MTESRLFVAAATIALSLTAPWRAGSQSVASLREITALIAAADEDAGRRGAITAQLDAAGIAYRLQDFEDRQMRKGTNVIVTLQDGGGSPAILIGAHGVLIDAIRRAASDATFPLRESPPSEYPGSDHRSMIAAGIETVGIALIDGSEIDGVQSFLRKQSTELPNILKTIHTPNDTMDVVRPAEMEKAIPVLATAVRAVMSRR